MKKKPIHVLIISLIAVVSFAVGYVIYMETHFSATTSVPIELSPEQILNEMPSIAISEKDIAMGKALLATDEMAKAFLLATEDKNGVYVVPLDDAEKLLAEWIPEDFEVLELAVLNEHIYVSFLNRDKQSIYYSFDSNFEYQNKTIGIYGKDLFGRRIVKAIYQNMNGEITKFKEKQLWFEWMKDAEA